MAKVLHGFTDLLQPINLLPDVLAGGGGYPLSGSMKDGSSISDRLNITYGSESGGKTVTYNFSNRNLRVYTDNTNNLRFFIYIQKVGSAVANTIYTFKVELENNSTSNASFRLSYGSGGIYYYSSTQTNGNIVTLTSIGMATGSYGYGIWFQIPSGESGKLDFTIKNVAVYEGAYTKPPFCKSIAQLNNEGLMGNLVTSDLSQVYKNNAVYLSTSGSSSQWYRLLCLPTQTNHLYKICLTADKGFNNRYPHNDSIELNYFVHELPNIEFTYNFSFKRYIHTSIMTGTIQKYRFVLRYINNEPHFFLEGYFVPNGGYGEHYGFLIREAYYMYTPSGSVTYINQIQEVLVDSTKLRTASESSASTTLVDNITPTIIS